MSKNTQKVNMLKHQNYSIVPSMQKRTKNNKSSSSMVRRNVFSKVLDRQNFHATRTTRNHKYLGTTYFFSGEYVFQKTPRGLYIPIYGRKARNIVNDYTSTRLIQKRLSSDLTDNFATNSTAGRVTLKIMYEDGNSLERFVYRDYFDSKLKDMLNKGFDYDLSMIGPSYGSDQDIVYKLLKRNMVDYQISITPEDLNYQCRKSFINSRELAWFPYIIDSDYLQVDLSPFQIYSELPEKETNTCLINAVKQCTFLSKQTITTIENTITPPFSKLKRQKLTDIMGCQVSWRYEEKTSNKQRVILYKPKVQVSNQKANFSEWEGHIWFETSTFKYSHGKIVKGKQTLLRSLINLYQEHPEAFTNISVGTRMAINGVDHDDKEKDIIKQDDLWKDYKVNDDVDGKPFEFNLKAYITPRQLHFSDTETHADPITGKQSFACGSDIGFYDKSAQEFNNPLSMLDSYKHQDVIYFHNMKFDETVIASSLHDNPKEMFQAKADAYQTQDTEPHYTFGEIIGPNNDYYSIKVTSTKREFSYEDKDGKVKFMPLQFEFRCSLAIFQTALADLPDAYKLPKVNKEIFPYDYFNQEYDPVNKTCIVDLESFYQACEHEHVSKTFFDRKIYAFNQTITQLIKDHPTKPKIEKGTYIDIEKVKDMTNFVNDIATDYYNCNKACQGKRLSKEEYKLDFKFVGEKITKLNEEKQNIVREHRRSYLDSIKQYTSEESIIKEDKLVITKTLDGTLLKNPLSLSKNDYKKYFLHFYTKKGKISWTTIKRHISHDYPEFEFHFTEHFAMSLHKKYHMYNQDYIKKCTLPSGKFDLLKYNQLYCNSDVILLRDAYKKAIALFYVLFGAYLPCFLSLSSVGEYIMQKKGAYNGTYKIGRLLRVFCQAACVGGRTTPSNTGTGLLNLKHHIKNRRILDEDINSSYVDSITRSTIPIGMPHMHKRQSNMKRILKMKTDNVKHYYIIRAYVDKHCIRNKMKIPLFYCEDEILYTGDKDNIRKITQQEYESMTPKEKQNIQKREITRSWNNADIENWREDEKKLVVWDMVTFSDMIKFHNLDLTKFHPQQILLWSDSNNKCQSIAQKIYDKRIFYKKRRNGPFQLVIKNTGNCLYGKSLLKPQHHKNFILTKPEYDKIKEKQPTMMGDYERLNSTAYGKCQLQKPWVDHYNFCYFGAQVLSRSKTTMTKVFYACEKLDIDYFYTDTDSCFIDGGDNALSKIKDYYMKNYGHIMEDKYLLGALSSDFKVDDLKRVYPFSKSESKELVNHLKSENQSIEDFQEECKTPFCYELKVAAKKIYHCEMAYYNSDFNQWYHGSHTRSKGVNVSSIEARGIEYSRIPNTRSKTFAQQRNKEFTLLLEGNQMIYDQCRTSNGYKVSMDFNNPYGVVRRDTFKRKLQCI